MTFSDLDDTIQEAREAYVALRGYLRTPEELSPLDGVFNAIKSPQRLMLPQSDASLDQSCESLEYMITSLHRVSDLLTKVWRRCMRRTGVGNYSVDLLLKQLQDSPGFQYFEHFTNGVKHSVYVRRGMANGVLCFDRFEYLDHGKLVSEPSHSAAEIVEMARETIQRCTLLMHSMAHTLKDSELFDESYAEVCATPTLDPNLYAVHLEDAE